MSEKSNLTFESGPQSAEEIKELYEQLFNDLILDNIPNNAKINKFIKDLPYNSYDQNSQHCMFLLKRNNDIPEMPEFEEFQKKMESLLSSVQDPEMLFDLLSDDVLFDPVNRIIINKMQKEDISFQDTIYQELISDNEMGYKKELLISAITEPKLLVDFLKHVFSDPEYRKNFFLPSDSTRESKVGTKYYFTKVDERMDDLMKKNREKSTKNNQPAYYGDAFSESEYQQFADLLSKEDTLDLSNIFTTFVIHLDDPQYLLQILKKSTTKSTHPFIKEGRYNNYMFINLPSSDLLDVVKDEENYLFLTRLNAATYLRRGDMTNDSDFQYLIDLLTNVDLTQEHKEQGGVSDRGAEEVNVLDLKKRIIIKNGLFDYNIEWLKELKRQADYTSPELSEIATKRIKGLEIAGYDEYTTNQKQEEAEEKAKKDNKNKLKKTRDHIERSEKMREERDASYYQRKEALAQAIDDFKGETEEGIFN